MWNDPISFLGDRGSSEMSLKSVPVHLQSIQKKVSETPLEDIGSPVKTVYLQSEPVSGRCVKLELDPEQWRSQGKL